MVEEKNAPSPDWMVDCRDCGSQYLSLIQITDAELLIVCMSEDCVDSKGKQEMYSLSDESNGGTDCYRCQGTTWNVIENEPDEHLLIECENCGDIAEIWLKADAD